MASFDAYWPLLQRLEGTTYVEDPHPTKRGITLATWQAYGWDKNGDGVNDVRDLKLITAADAYVIYKKHYWGRCRADLIANQSLAELVVDFVINGGPAISSLQRFAGRKATGTMTTADVQAINGGNALKLHGQLWVARKEYYYRLVQLNPAKKKYLAGWLVRLNKFTASDMSTTGLGVGSVLIGAAVSWFAYQKLSSSKSNNHKSNAHGNQKKAKEKSYSEA